MRSDAQPGHKRAEISAALRIGGPPGAHVRSPPTPEPRTPSPPRCHETDPKLGRGGPKSRRAGAFAPPLVGARQRQPPVPGGSEEARRGRVSPPRSPPQRPARSPRPRWPHSSLTPRDIPRGPPARPGSAAPHQSATCQRFSEPRAAAAADALAPAAAPPPSWLRPEVTSARSPQPPTPTPRVARGLRPRKELNTTAGRDPGPLCRPLCQSPVHPRRYLEGKSESPLPGQPGHCRVMAEKLIVPQRIHLPLDDRGRRAWWHTL